ncbi:MAG: exo-alpha-sialidase [Prevotellaceae bacterium]|jgi:hypothetical protein|nr:exo-alpha-sialidase [Prevotellaceae bacterium]
MTKNFTLAAALCALPFFALAQAGGELRYAGRQQSNPDYHHGQLSPAVGVHNVQIFRANRQFPELAEGFGWTYNHAPMIAYWSGKFYVCYLSNPLHEHGQPGQTLLLSSPDGYAWSKPTVVFPTYEAPAGTLLGKDKLPTYPGLNAVMHQRMAFYVSKSNRLLLLGFYGISHTQKDSPFGENGIGRVVRECRADGTLGDVYFIRYSKGWSEKNTRYPFYTKSKDKAFVAACNELLANRLMTQQWGDESNEDDPIISLKGDHKAFCFYHLPDSRVVGLWKHARYAVSADEGKTWTEPKLATNVVTWNAKIWGQKTSDNRYALVYNPSLYRWPLAVMTSHNGLDYDSLLVVHGEISTRRYEGGQKSFGPQYVRGIAEGNGTPPDGKMWLAYSVNKEDIWVASVPIPVAGKVSGAVNDVFADMRDGEELQRWNIYSPLWAPVSIGKSASGQKCLLLRDRDRYDYAKAERVFAASKNPKLEFTVTPAQSDNGTLHVELQDAKGAVCLRLVFDSEGNLKLKPRAKFTNLLKYEANREYRVGIDLNTDVRRFDITVNGKTWKGQWCMTPVESVERIAFRTGERRYHPTIDTMEDDGSGDMPRAGEPEKEAAFAIGALKVQ